MNGENNEPQPQPQSERPQKRMDLSVRCTETLQASEMCTELARLLNIPNCQVMHLLNIAVIPRTGVDPTKVQMIDLYRAFYIIPTESSDVKTKSEVVDSSEDPRIIGS